MYIYFCSGIFNLFQKQVSRLSSISQPILLIAHIWKKGISTLDTGFIKSFAWGAHSQFHNHELFEKIH